MLVQRVVMPVSGRESWTLLGDDGEVVEPAERYLAYLAAIVERSLNMVRAYAVSLKLWFEFPAAPRWAGTRRAWRTWPGLWPGCAPRGGGNVIVLADGAPGRGNRRRVEQVPGRGVRLL